MRCISKPPGDFFTGIFPYGIRDFKNNAEFCNISLGMNAELFHIVPVSETTTNQLPTMKTVSDLQSLSITDLTAAAKNGMTEAQMKGCKVAQHDRRIVTDPEVLKVFADRAASLAAFNRIANLHNDGQDFVSYTNEFVAAVKAAILA
jgi:hypothetical protein